MTVEIGYALVSGFLVAAATFAGISSPAFFLDLPVGVGHFLFGGGAVLGAAAFVIRVVHVLWRFPRSRSDLPQGAGRPIGPGPTGLDT